MTFSRGLSTGWLEGIDNQKLVHARFGKKRGLQIGTVERLEREGVWVQSDTPLKAGDGVVFDRGRPDEFEEGGRITTVDTTKTAPLFASSKAPSTGSVSPRGTHSTKPPTPHSIKRCAKATKSNNPTTSGRLQATVSGQVDSVLRISLRDEEGRVVEVESDQPIEAARNKPTDEATLKKQLGRLGSTAFFLQSLDNQLGTGCMVPASVLNHLRRDAVDRLVALRAQPLRWELISSPRATTAHNQEQPRIRT